MAIKQKSLSERIDELIPLLGTVIGRASSLEVKTEPAGSTPNSEYFELELKYSDEEGKEREEKYHIKRFLQQNRQGKVASFFSAKRGNIQAVENEILNRYKEEGCNVPSSYVKAGEDILILESIRGEKLEKKLVENRADEEKRKNLIERTSLKLADLHHAGRKIQGNILDTQILRSTELMQRSALYCAVICASEEDLVKMAKEGNGNSEIIKTIKNKHQYTFSKFNKFFEIFAEHFSSQETQLIHGDMATYHVIFDVNETPWFIDFGKPKFSNIVFDLAPLYFSQDTALPIEAIEEVFLKYLERENMNLTGQKTSKLPKERFIGKFKSLLYGDCFENIRRGSKSRFLRVVYPKEYSQFIKAHPSYKNSMPYYKKSTLDVIEYLLKRQDGFKINKEQGEHIKQISRLLEHYDPNKSLYFSSRDGQESREIKKYFKKDTKKNNFDRKSYGQTLKERSKRAEKAKKEIA